MGAMAITFEWQVEYHETMAATGKVRLAVARGVNILNLARIAIDLKVAVGLTGTLVVLLKRLEASPSSVLLEGEAQSIPPSLRKLFQATCGMLEQATAKGLDDNWLTKGSLTRIDQLNQQICGFADRFEDAVRMLSTRVTQQEVEAYRASLEAYANCEPASDAPDEADVKSGLLHF